MFGQMLLGCEPRPSETVNKVKPSNYKQSSIFGDIQPWNLSKTWTEVCSNGAWINDAEPSNTWTSIANTTNSWVDETSTPIDTTRC